MTRDLEATIDRLVATCACPACERYRKAFAARVGYWAAKIEEQLKPETKR